MCLITRQRKAIITKEDMIVYKDLSVTETPIYDTSAFVFGGNSLNNTSTASHYSRTSKEYRSLYQDHIWNVNTLYETQIQNKIHQSKYIEQGHYFEFYDYTSRHHYISDKMILPLFMSSISTGFHFALKMSRFLTPFDIFKFMIPAGSQVFYDETDLGVTNKIIFLDPSNSKL